MNDKELANKLVEVAELNERIEKLEAALIRIREISVESGAHITVAFCDVARIK